MGRPFSNEARHLKWARWGSLTSPNSMDHRWTEATDLETQPVSRVWDLYRPEEGNRNKMTLTTSL